MKDVWGNLSVDRILINVTKLLFIFFNFSPAPSPFSFFFFVSWQGLALLPRLRYLQAHTTLLPHTPGLGLQVLTATSGPMLFFLGVARSLVSVEEDFCKLL